MSSDPLLTLRRCISENKFQSHDPTTREIMLDTEKFPQSAPTRFRNKMGDPYSIGALWFFYITCVTNGVPNRQYVADAIAQDFQQVSVVDARPIQEYLTGVKDEDAIPQIVKLTEASVTAQPAATSSDAPKELSQLLSEDKLAELKAKRQKARGDTDALTSAVYRSEASIKEILARERPYLDRKTVLQASKRNFSKLLERMAEIKAGKAASNGSKPAETKQPSRQQAPAASSNRSNRSGYDRFEQSEERVWKASGIELEMGINTRGTFDPTADPFKPAANIFSAGNSAASRKRPYEQIASEPMDVDMEIDDEYKAPAPAPSAQPIQSAKPTEPPKKKRKYADASLDPLILVPNGNDAKAMLHAANALKFLQEGQYVDDRTSRTRSFTIERPSRTGDGKVSFTVSDGSRMTPKDWDRVVCVVVNGTDWQFKSFPAELQVPANLFTAVKGYYLRFDDEPAPATVRSWNVAQLSISKPRRHLDQAASKRFWEELEQFIHTNRPEIRH